MISDRPNVLLERMTNRPGVPLSSRSSGMVICSLDLLGREPGRLRDHLRGHVGDVGIGFERELGPGVIAVDGQEDAHHPDHQALLEGEDDQAINH